MMKKKLRICDFKTPFQTAPSTKTTQQPQRNLRKQGNQRQYHKTKFTKKGKPALLTFPIETLLYLDATKRQTPTGGVVNPIIRFKTAMTAT